MRKTDTPKRIILTAIDLINEGGTEKVTTLSIDERDGVNSAVPLREFVPESLK